jgi:hypothetical protein
LFQGNIIGEVVPHIEKVTRTFMAYFGKPLNFVINLLASSFPQDPAVHIADKDASAKKLLVIFFCCPQ